MADFSLIDSNVSKHISLSEAEKEIFHGLLSFRKFKKKEFALREGGFCSDNFFVIGGCMRGYTTDKNGFEHVLSFAPPDWWIGDFYGYLTGKPAILNVQAIENTEVIVLSKQNQELLYEKVPKFERYYRIIVERSLVAHQQRIINDMSLSAEERFEYFCAKYPSLVHTLPQKHIASFLGVTPEFFSKMRSKLLRKK